MSTQSLSHDHIPDLQGGQEVQWKAGNIWGASVTTIINHIYSEPIAVLFPLYCVKQNNHSLKHVSLLQHKNKISIWSL